MLVKRIVPGSIDLLRQGMVRTALRHSVILHNIANADTPGYRRKDVRFSDVLSAEKATLSSTGTVYEDDRPGLRQDGNNVVIEEEMALLSSNAGKYLTYVQLHEREMRMVRMAISERLI